MSTNRFLIECHRSLWLRKTKLLKPHSSLGRDSLGRGCSLTHSAGAHATLPGLPEVPPTSEESYRRGDKCSCGDLGHMVIKRTQVHWRRGRPCLKSLGDHWQNGQVTNIRP